MKTSQNKQATKLLKNFLNKKGIKSLTGEFYQLGEVSVRIVSMSETDKYNWDDQKYGNVINVEVTAKKSGFSHSENRIPSKHSFYSSSRQRFFKNRKYFTNCFLCDLFSQSDVKTFLKLASITIPRREDEIIGKITYKYID